MLGNVLPGLRELRAPLAAGYLWVVAFWLIFGDELPTSSEHKAPPLDRLYRLEPIVSSVGLAVVASVAAYLLGSVAIDVMSRIGSLIQAVYDRRPLTSRLPNREVTLSLTPAGRRILHRWAGARAEEVKDLLRQRVERARAAVREAREREVSAVATSKVAEHRAREAGADAAPAAADSEEAEREIEEASEAAEQTSQSVDWIMENADIAAGVMISAGSYISSNRDLLKMQLLDLTQPLHSEIDRPDAEATFRMALWPPLSVLVVYVAAAVSGWWILALTLPALLAWQWISLRRRANDALVAAFVARDLGGEDGVSEIRNATMADLLDAEETSRRSESYWRLRSRDPSALARLAERAAAHNRSDPSSHSEDSS